MSVFSACAFFALSNVASARIQAYKSPLLLAERWLVRRQGVSQKMCGLCGFKSSSRSKLNCTLVLICLLNTLAAELC